jgi:hypothetical protein
MYTRLKMAEEIVKCSDDELGHQMAQLLVEHDSYLPQLDRFFQMSVEEMH